MNDSFEYFEENILSTMPSIFSTLSPFKPKKLNNRLYNLLESEIYENSQVLVDIEEETSIKAFHRILYFFGKHIQKLEIQSISAFSIEIIDFMSSQDFIKNPKLVIYEGIEDFKNFNHTNTIPLLWWYILEENIRKNNDSTDTLNILHKINNCYKDILRMIDNQSHINHNIEIAKMQSNAIAGVREVGEERVAKAAKIKGSEYGKRGKGKIKYNIEFQEFINEVVTKNPLKSQEELWMWLNRNYKPENEYQTNTIDISFHDNICTISQLKKGKTYTKIIKKSSFYPYFKRAKDLL